MAALSQRPSASWTAALNFISSDPSAAARATPFGRMISTFTSRTASPASAFRRSRAASASALTGRSPIMSPLSHQKRNSRLLAADSTSSCNPPGERASSRTVAAVLVMVSST